MSLQQVVVLFDEICNSVGNFTTNSSEIRLLSIREIIWQYRFQLERFRRRFKFAKVYIQSGWIDEILSSFIYRFPNFFTRESKVHSQRIKSVYIHRAFSQIGIFCYIILFLVNFLSIKIVVLLLFQFLTKIC